VVKHFSLGGGVPRAARRGALRAVDGVSFELQPGETVSLVGESGCGKTTTAKLILRLEDVSGGKIFLRGREVQDLRGQALREYWHSLQAVFQDPWSSLNPRMRVGDIVGEPLLANHRLKGRQLSERVEQLLVDVGLDPGIARSYPHELSGGMRQRLAIARALSLQPALIVLDEPVSALDVSIRAQVMNLLKDLQDRLGIAYLLIAHDLATVRYLSHQVAVMYLGQIVEFADGEVLFTHPQHPYTQALIAAALPGRMNQSSEIVLLNTDVPSPANPPSGCRFHTRCPFAMPRCVVEEPLMRETEPGHRVACHLVEG
jgi:oligopeptide/dipeptide ABC transporter ATP-binding protein